MNFFSQRRLGQRLAWGFGTVLALLLGIAALSLIGMQNLNRTLQEVVIQGGHRTAAVVGMERSAYRFMSSLRDIRGSELSDSEAMMKRLRQDWDTYLSKEKAAKESLPANDANVAALFDQVGQRARAVHEVIPLGEKESGGRGEPAVFFAISLALGQDAAAWNTKYHQWSEGLVALSAWDDRAKEASVADASATADGAQKVVVAGSLIALLFGALGVDPLLEAEQSDDEVDVLALVIIAEFLAILVLLRGVLRFGDDRQAGEVAVIFRLPVPEAPGGDRG